MPVFKYYRPNIYFEKAIRYNELYFAANHELNDPNDLKGTYFFENNPSRWSDLFFLDVIGPMWDIKQHVNPKSVKLTTDLDELFKGVEIDSITGSIRLTVEEKKSALKEIFISAIEYGEPPAKGFESLKQMSSESRADLCVLILTSLLCRAVNHRMYSVSFSSKALSPMMWAHYADGFKGCVGIYGGNENSKIELRHHPLLQEPDYYPVFNVTYINSEKRIPILECAIKGKQKAVEAFLQKNAFWEYESELRALTIETLDPIRLALRDDIENNRQRILHHNTNNLVGIIFGPRCTQAYQAKIVLIAHSNRYYHDKQSFYVLNTRLTSSGDVEISKASRCICKNEAPFYEIFEGEKMSRLVSELGIL